MDKRVDYRKELKLVVIKRSFPQSFTASSIRLKDTGAKLGGIPESTATILLGDWQLCGFSTAICGFLMPMKMAFAMVVRCK